MATVWKVCPNTSPQIPVSIAEEVKNIICIFISSAAMIEDCVIIVIIITVTVIMTTIKHLCNLAGNLLKYFLAAIIKMV